MDYKDELMSWCSLKKTTGCWIWEGAKLHNGYGKTTKGKRAHRESHILFIGEIPENMVVMHKCNNRLCINPRHLKLGTPAENSAYMVKQGRSAKGEKHSQAKLKEHQVIDIRKKLDSGITAAKLSKELNISRLTITDIKLRKTWRYI